MDTIKACQARAMAWANRIEAERLDKPELFQKENYKVISIDLIALLSRPSFKRKS